MKKLPVIMLMAGIAAIVGGCAGNAPTAESLIAAAYPDDMQTTKGTMEIAIDISASAEQLGVDGTMEMSMNMNADMESDSDTTKIDGSAEIKLFGMTVRQDVAEYSQTDGDKTTNYSYSEDEGWIYEVVDAKEHGERKLDASVFKDLELQPFKKGDQEYVVTAVMNIGDLTSSLTPGVSGISEEVDMTDYSDAELNISITFDKETKYITGFTAELASPYMQDGTEISKMLVSVKNMKFSNESVEVPADVIRQAVDAVTNCTEEMLFDEAVSEELAQEQTGETVREEIPETVFENSEITEDVENSEKTEDLVTAQAGVIKESEAEDAASDAGMSSTLELSKVVYGKDFIYEDELIELSGGRLKEGDDLNSTIISDICYYTKQEFLEYLEFWKYFETNDKLACAYIADLGIVPAEDMVVAGVPEEELNDLIESIK